MAKREATSSMMTLQAHIREARNRLFVVALAFLVFSTLAYAFRDNIIYLLLQPLAGEELSYLTPGGGFSFIFKVLMWTGIAASFPVAIYSLYKFVTPMMPQRVRSYAVALLLASSALLVAGVCFGYIFAIPGAIKFLLTFADTYVSAMLTADSYLSFILAYTLGLGVIFQIPLILLIIHWIKPLKPKQLMSFQRYVIVAAFVIAAILTPTPDPTNQVIIAAPMIALYQAGVATVSVSIWRERRTQREQARRNTNTHAVSSSVQTVPTHRKSSPPQSTAKKPVQYAAAPKAIQQVYKRGRSIDGIRTRPKQRQGKLSTQINNNIHSISHQRMKPLSIDGVRRRSTV